VRECVCRHVHIRASHVGMDSKTFLYQLAHDDSVEAHKRKWRAKFGDKHVVCQKGDVREPSRRY
jgi:hypothetical protein